ncbi:ATP-grasp domain-containing protein [Lederbergia citri]|uniref:ATP-grasp domain-containing protein n=1 Tax=Lederbergia citri TaxID=2833580 RepID=A0A942TD54_9BACI|nr:ATP-grasp domain-containing protein [Lederbergia citri]MBS4195490.1 ATP-grasp domain-containing protein [Lederbergia citri]
MNVLITSISGKVPLIQTVEKAMKKINSNSVLYGGDVDDQCIGKYFVDRFWLMPPLKDMTKETFVSYCTSKNITIIFPTRDADLLYFSSFLSYFTNNGLYIMVSNKKSLEITMNKMNFFKIGVEKGFPVTMSSFEIDTLYADTFVVKECEGSGSKNIAINVSREQAILHAKQLKGPLFQPYIKGEEFSIDVYVDKLGKSKGVIVRKRIQIKDGESQITRTIRHKELERLGAEMAEMFCLYGHVMFQVIVDLKGKPHIIECNPRFGGASTLSIAAGLDSFYWFQLEAAGEDLHNYPFHRSEKELTLIRHAKDMIV